MAPGRCGVPVVSGTAEASSHESFAGTPFPDTRSEDWRWRSEEAAILAYSTSDLAAMCVDSVKQTLAEDRA